MFVWSANGMVIRSSGPGSERTTNSTNSSAKNYARLGLRRDDSISQLMLHSPERRTATLPRPTRLPAAVFFLLNWSLALPPANASPARTRVTAYPPRPRRSVFLLLSFYFLLSFDSSFCLLDSCLLKSLATYAEAFSDRELALPRHAQLRRRFEIPRASCARRHRGRFPQRQNLP